ncbi:hypothetical protein F2Q70_00013829 [Brassica cretica]|uniref:Uncharacterized protein n=2 Tax=Brassica cretica TaxID=69181 RepID=A0A8S9M329_BRACR|nr:hypothetical protein F2Q70_00013829 [Brassica cretica]KAF3507698.1 hypothetical protein F2Q69_00010064 [Brassica cretica]KAF3550713.1 hypothetical protein DY000_02010524 [Brassica cretica]
MRRDQLFITGDKALTLTLPVAVMENVRKGATVTTRPATIINHEPLDAHAMTPESRAVIHQRSYQPLM